MERDKMTKQEAVDFMEFNVIGAYVGLNTPVFIMLQWLYSQKNN